MFSSFSNSAFSMRYFKIASIQQPPIERVFKPYDVGFNTYFQEPALLEGLRQKQEFRRPDGMTVKFESNGAVVLKDEKSAAPKGTVVKGVIADAAFFEMKNKNNGIDKTQIEAYLDISKKLKVTKLVTVSNEFVADSSHSPIKVKPPKSISLYHFSWTYLLTR